MTGKIEPTTSGTRHQWCRYSGPGRGDCEHFIGLPAVYDETTTDEYGIPNGWCDYCWKAEQTKRLHNEIEALTRRNAELTAALERAWAHMDELSEAWRRGAIHETDGHGGLRSNANTELVHDVGELLGRHHFAALTPTESEAK